MIRVLASLVAVSFVSGCASDTIRNDDGEVISAGPWSVFDLRPGDCITNEGVLGGDNMVPLVPCDDPHTMEVFAVVRSPQTMYPGDAELATFADQACLTAMPRPFEELPDRTMFSYMLPTEKFWTENDDRNIVCVFIFPDEDTVGSIVTGTDKFR